MQFLSRKRTKRQVVTKKGTICCKGFTYQYRLNKQGISYCAYLRRPKFDRDLEQNIRRKEITLKAPSTYFFLKEANELIGPANGIALLKIAEYFSSYFSVQSFNGRYKRFPPQRDHELFYILFTLLALNKKDKDLITGYANIISFLLEKAVAYEKDLKRAISFAEKALSYAEKAGKTAMNPAGEENGLYWLRKARSYFASKNFNIWCFPDDELVSRSRGFDKGISAQLFDLLDWLIRDPSLADPFDVPKPR